MLMEAIERDTLHRWDPAQGLRRLRHLFNDSGLVMLDGIQDSEHFLDSMKGLGNVHHHVDSLPNGLTHVRSATHAVDRSEAADLNRLGLTQDGLVPHTDRSSLPNPPRLLAFWIERQSSVGGSTLFVDGHRLFDDLSAREPAAIDVLMRPRSVVFKSEAGLREGSLFAMNGDRLTVRFRLDRMVYMSPDVAAVVPTLMTLMRASTIKMRLAARQGYLIDNHRWLHGRTHFHGERSAFRLLLDEAADS
jgi:alpha-ketoglutarate-dependent taurine dioxygenase